MAQAISRLLLTAEGQVRSPVSMCEICGRQNGVGQVSFEYFGFPLPIFFQRCAILIFICILLLPEGQTREA